MGIVGRLAAALGAALLFLVASPVAAQADRPDQPLAFAPRLAIERDRPLSLGDGVEFPLRPTHEIQIDYETGPYKGVTILALVVYSEGRWRELGPCVRPDNRLLAEGRKVDAIKEYQRAAGVDLSTAKSVVESIMPQ